MDTDHPPSSLDPATLDTLGVPADLAARPPFGGAVYADWYCDTYLGQPDFRHMSPDDLPDHPFAWQWFPGEDVRGQLDNDGEPFTPAEVEARAPCRRCGSAFEPEGPWHFDWGDGRCMRDIVCPAAPPVMPAGHMGPTRRPKADDEADEWAVGGTADA